MVVITGIVFLLLNVFLDEKGTLVKIQLPNIFKDHHIIANLKPTIAGEEWPLSVALWRKLYNSHGKYKPELNEYFHMYQCQLNFVLFAATSVLGISWQRLNHRSLLVQAVYRSDVYFHVRSILHKLHISLPHEDEFSEVKNDFEDRAHYSVCDEYGVDLAETWMYGECFYTIDYTAFGHGVKATERSPTDKLTRWIITQSKCLTRNGTEKINRSVMTYVYLVLSSQVKARSTMARNSAPVADAQKVFKNMFNDLIRGDLSIDTKK